ncbi:MAG: MFS transporter [Chloroflexi bacterium]|nr:MFS transporter [Chloroflexota bacterium]
MTSDGSRGVLLTLASAQFLMTLDSSVMNVSIATVAADLGTTVTGIQTAITLYTLVMATLMLTGGKIGAIVGRRHAFSIGCVIYAAGSFTTAVAPNVGVLLVGWSLLEGIGAALIMPGIVALVASNVPPSGRPRAYGLVAAAGAIAVAVGPLIGGAVTTFASWRLIFVAEVAIAAAILLLARRVQDAAPGKRVRLDVVGSLLSIVGLGLAVFGVLRSSSWGWVLPKPDAPQLVGVSAVAWLILAGLLVLWGLLIWETRVEQRGRDPLVRPSMFRNGQLVGGLTMFLFQYFVQAGVFFTIPLFLSVVLQLSALETGVRIVPLSVALLISAVAVPRLWPTASPRRVVRLGLVMLLAATLLLIGVLDADATAAVVTLPLILLGIGIGALASQLASVTVSSVPDEDSSEVGGLQNTALNLGASLGTALVGSVLIAALSSLFLQGVLDHPDIPQSLKTEAERTFGAGVPFVSDTQLTAELVAYGVPPTTIQDVLAINSEARLAALRSALFVVAATAMLALFFTGGIPTRQPGATAEADRRTAGEDVPEAADTEPASAPGCQARTSLAARSVSWSRFADLEA